MDSCHINISFESGQQDYKDKKPLKILKYFPIQVDPNANWSAQLSWTMQAGLIAWLWQ